MQTLPWRQRMRREMGEEKEEGQWERKKSCVKAHNKTYTRPRRLHLLPQQEEEKAFHIGHPLGPNLKKCPSNFSKLYSQPSICFLQKKPVSFLCCLCSRKWKGVQTTKPLELEVGGPKKTKTNGYIGIGGIEEEEKFVPFGCWVPKNNKLSHCEDAIMHNCYW